MTKKYNLHSMTDMVDLAKYVQTCVYWGGYFIRKDDETSHRWKDFWDHLEEAIQLGRNNTVVIREADNVVEFM